jgi:hypothetical protein
MPCPVYSRTTEHPALFTIGSIMSPIMDSASPGATPFIAAIAASRVVKTKFFAIALTFPIKNVSFWSPNHPSTFVVKSTLTISPSSKISLSFGIP